MAENKKGFVLYADQKSIIDMLPNEKAGELIKHIFAYVNDENPVNDDPLILMAFEPIKLQLKRDLIKWEDTRSKRSKAGTISAEKRKQQNEHMLTHVESVEHNSTNPTVIVKDNVNVKDKVKVKSNIIPDFSDFLAYAIKERPMVDKDKVQAKYDTWVSNGWKDGYDNKISNWKTKLKNTLPHIPEKVDISKMTSEELRLHITKGIAY